MDLFEVLENLRAEDASVDRLFRGEGRSIRGLRRSDPRYIARLAETAGFIGEVLQGRRPSYHLQEAMTTSDFPLLFGDILDRQMYANYQEAPYTWNLLVKRSTVRDFREVKRFTLEGGDTPLDKVPEKTEYPADKLVEGSSGYRVYKYGRRMPFSWESMINDDLDALKNVPETLGRAARRTEERLVTEMFVDANGPKSTFFTVGNKNVITGNPPLSIAGLQAGFTQLAAQVDAQGEPIVLDSVTLWVPPALEIPAMNILNALQLEVTEAGGTANQKLIAVNWMRNRLKLSVGYYIPSVASSANGSTSWFMFGDPNRGRPAGELAFLRGHEAPEIWMKSPNATRVGGGVVDSMDGDFDTDSIQYRVRHVTGGATVDPKAVIASNGSGT
jgi:hypothetical protein